MKKTLASIKVGEWTFTLKYEGALFHLYPLRTNTPEWAIQRAGDVVQQMMDQALAAQGREPAVRVDLED